MTRTTMTTWTTRSATPRSSLSSQFAIRQTSAQLGRCHQLEGKDARAMLTRGASGRAKTQRDKDDDVSKTTVTTPARCSQGRQRSAGKEASAAMTLWCMQHRQWEEASATRMMPPASGERCQCDARGSGWQRPSAMRATTSAQQR
jgi:hypothetical protein